MSKLYGWYSAKEAAHWTKLDKYEYASFNTDCFEQKIADQAPVIYTTPDGTEICVTEVTTTPEMKVDMFGDFVFLGEVVKFVRSLG